MKKFLLIPFDCRVPAVLMLLALLFAGCEGEDEPIPAYVHINEFVVESTNPNTHGSVSQKITEASVFLVYKNSIESPHQLGILTLPAVVPAIVSGEFEINIDPIVRANGNSLYLEVYPFYERYQTTVNLSPNEDIEVNPTTRYRTDANFVFVENFENNSHLFQEDRDNNPNTFIEITDVDVFEGEKSGMVSLDTANNFFVATTLDPIEILIADAKRVYMEVDYKTDVPLEFGVLIYNPSNGSETPNLEFVVFPRDEWNKIYFDMTQLVAQAPTNNFIFVIRGGIPTEDGVFTLNEAKVFLDNIKLVTF